jgi:iron complex transport system substrate-binding protein
LPDSSRTWSWFNPGANGLDRRLASLHIPAATVGQGNTLQSVLASIRQVASAAGIAARGDALAADVQRRLDAIRTAGRTTARPRVLFIIGRQPGQLTDLVGIGPGSYLDDLIEIAGGINVLAIAGQPEYPRISMEAVLRLDPDVIIDTVDMGDTDAERATRQPVNEHLWSAYPGLTAVRAGRVRAATTDTLVVPGPRIVEAASGWSSS